MHSLKGREIGMYDNGLRASRVTDDMYLKEKWTKSMPEYCSVEYGSWQDKAFL